MSQRLDDQQSGKHGQNDQKWKSTIQRQVQFLSRKLQNFRNLVQQTT